jgi:hypothetical protein
LFIGKGSSDKALQRANGVLEVGGFLRFGRFANKTLLGAKGN